MTELPHQHVLKPDTPAAATDDIGLAGTDEIYDAPGHPDGTTSRN